jgi:hypothetical protein
VEQKFANKTVLRNPTQSGHYSPDQFLTECRHIAARSSGSTWSGCGEPIRWRGHLVGPVMMAHGIQLLTAAVYADEQLIVQTNDSVGWLNQLEP